ncbi:MAG: hypothetical protein KAY32_18160, partial [Candidatus Eisenbacteria sp.]|nr:hypothetical protein [Candidatus Eisenbacteria bacterium]
SEFRGPPLTQGSSCAEKDRVRSQPTKKQDKSRIQYDGYKEWNWLMTLDPKKLTKTDEQEHAAALRAVDKLGGLKSRGTIKPQRFVAAYIREVLQAERAPDTLEGATA